MSINLYSALATNKSIQKISALVIAFLYWSHLTSLQQQTITAQVPLCFYDLAAEHTLEAPETIVLTLRGKKSDLARIQLPALAAHCDASQLHAGKNGLMITHKELFLPETISVVHYTPLPLVVVKEKLAE